MAKGVMHRMMVSVSRWMIACDEASFLISLRQDQPLSSSQQWQLRVHLISCHFCRKYARQIVEMQYILERYRKGFTAENTSHRLPAEARERIRRALSGEQNVK